MIDAATSPFLWMAVGGGALLVAVGVLHRLNVPFPRYQDRLRERFLLGVPWGTIVVIVGLLLVYLFVQRGWWHWYRPVVAPFTAASVSHPTGWLLAAFSHADPGHLQGNLTTLLVFGPIVEWIWGHRVPSPRGWRSRPAIRAFVLFPLGVVGIGIVAALCSWGPVIGFSIVVYALIGIVLVRYPLVALLGLLTREAVRLGVHSLRDPVELATVTVEVVDPGWYGSAVQGHLVGLFLGVLLASWAIPRTNRGRPSARRLFGAALLVGSSLSLWTLWWVTGPETFILFRAAGVILILLVAIVITLATTGRPTPRRRATAVLVAAVLCMGLVGIGVGAGTAPPPDLSPGYSVDSYEVYYGEGVPDGAVHLGAFERFGLSPDVRTDGVILVNEERGVWRQPISATELETHGGGRFTVGGFGWSEEVVVERRGWIVSGAGPVYDVRIGDGETFDVAYASEPRTARAVIANHSVGIRPESGGFAVTVRGPDDRTEQVAVPARNESVSVLGIEIAHSGNEIVAFSNDSAIPVAVREDYR